MRSKAIFMALLALTFGAQGASVSSDKARFAARAWMQRGSGSFPTSANAVVEKVTSHKTGNDVPFYAVKMSGGGTVFVSGDTMAGPIIAFAPSSADFSEIDKTSPLWALLERDAAIRSLGNSEKAQTAWDELLSDPAAPNGAGDAVPGHVNRVTELDDVRVRPLVQSRWNQGEVGEFPCFNRFTPVLSDGKNALCGCVATAMAQLMRYHRFPAEARPSVTNECTVEAASRGDPAAVTNLVTQGGTYDWANMPIVVVTNDNPNIEAQCEAIGKLTSDAGIAVGMNYDFGGSGAFSFNIAPALMEVFGYANAEYYRAKDAEKGFLKMSTEMERAMFANFDAGYPVLMGISGEGGHQIVGDGYGYKDGQPYVHLNMGWGSLDDVWYNLPQIDCEQTGYHFTVFQDIVFNVFPKADEGKAILAGRIVDEDGNAVPDVTVTVRRAGDGATVAGAVNLESGVYGFRVPASIEGERYVVKAVSADGEEVGLTDGSVVVRASQSSFYEYTGIITPVWTKPYRNRPVVTDVGNSWGNSLTVVPAPVRIGSVPYSSLDEALDAVSGEADVIEVLRPVRLRASRTVATACAIVATNDDPSASAVTRVGDAALTVADGGRLSLSNLVFAAGSNTVVDVKAGGCLEAAGTMGFGVVPADVPAVRTAMEDGFVLGGGFSGRLLLSCEASKGIGETFGAAICDYDSATNGVRWIGNGYDPEAELMAVAVTNLAGDIFLKWDERPVPLESCVGFYVDVNGVTNTAANLDRVFEKYEQAVAAGAGAGSHEIVIAGNGRRLGLMRPHEVMTDLTVRAAASGIVLSNFTETAGIAVSGSGALAVEGLEFRGYRGEGLFVVNGTRASLVVSNSTFRGIVGTGSHSGAIAILAGKAFAYDSIFEDCKAGDPQFQYGATSASGGAIYLEGTGCELHLCGGAITGCRALKTGGGVFVGNGATLGISGDLQVCGNLGTGGADDDIHVDGKFAVLTLEGALGARTDAIGIRYGTTRRLGYGNAPDMKFIDLSGAVAADEVARMSGIRTIFSDVTPTLDRVYDEGTLKWTTAAFSRKVTDGPVSLSGCSPEANGDYAFLADAVEATDGDGAVIRVKENVNFADTLTISNAVCIISDGPRTVTRVGDVSVRVVGGGKLDLDSVVFDGGDGTIRLFDINGGEMALGDGAVVRNVNGSFDRASGGVVVQNGGIFTMKDGSEIRDCVNTFTDDGSKAGYCGGLLVDNSKACLQGGTIAGCSAYGAGGVFVGSGSEVHISGAFTNIGNRILSGERSNLKVSDNSKLRLDGPFTGFCGYTEGAQGDTRQFGEIGFDGTVAQFAESAHRFTHDVTEDIGQAVVGSAGKLLVWNDALDDKTYTDGKGNDYSLVEGGAPIFIAVPQAKAGLAYTGEEQVGVEAGRGYSLIGNVAVDAGDHTATATPEFGFAWVGGSTDPVDVDWMIAKGDFNLDGVEFPGDEFICDGQVKSLKVKGEPSGITVTYANNDKTAVGVYEVKAFLTGGDGNHNPTSVTMTATLRIVNDPQAYPPGPVPPGPEYEVITNEATKVAFSEISRLDANTWRLVVTDRVEKCAYRLLSTEDLSAGFTVTDDWQVAEASGPWTNVLTRSAAAVFWRAEGADTVTTNYLNSSSEGE